MKVAAIQMDAGTTAVAERHAAIHRSLKDAAAAGADLVVLPELAPTGYGAGQAIVDTAEATDTGLAEWHTAADRLGIAIVMGLAVRTPQGVDNAAALLAPGSAPVLYAKRMLYGDYEKGLFTPGDAPSPIVEIAGLRCGLLVCFDVEFPELCRDLALRGADVILVPTALPQSDGARFIAQNVVPVRAFENQLFVVYADHCGSDGAFAYQGQSVIAAPDGLVLASAGEHDAAIILADLDPAAYRASRDQNPYLAETRSRRLTAT
ncbi:carbon-nitrogen hydrolase family protein [Aurantimonas sp. A2-1-M11]|uniref:carbon-nitrogen hydrolase family protein n=1 Tax=Aurantimonas sp. A2-1-M11 TaxID=3113712 RepID=UPI002F91E807